MTIEEAIDLLVEGKDWWNALVDSPLNNKRVLEVGIAIGTICDALKVKPRMTNFEKWRVGLKPDNMPDPGNCGIRCPMYGECKATVATCHNEFMAWAETEAGE